MNTPFARAFIPRASETKTAQLRLALDSALCPALPSPSLGAAPQRFCLSVCLQAPALRRRPRFPFELRHYVCEFLHLSCELENQCPQPRLGL